VKLVGMAAEQARNLGFTSLEESICRRATAPFSGFSFAALREATGWMPGEEPSTSQSESTLFPLYPVKWDPDVHQGETRRAKSSQPAVLKAVICIGLA
jgi:hypothetical protein